MCGQRQSQSASKRGFANSSEMGSHARSETCGAISESDGHLRTETALATIPQGTRRGEAPFASVVATVVGGTRFST